MNPEEIVRNAEMVLSIRTRQTTTSTTSDNCSTTTNKDVPDDADDDPHNETGPDGIMCVLWRNNKIGAAFFRKTDRQVSKSVPNLN